MNIEIISADYQNPKHGQDLLMLLNDYAQDPMGGGEPLSDHSQANLIAALQQTPNAFSVLCYVDGRPAGLVNCFQTLSTFKCKPVVNIHDMTVIKEFRGLGLSHKLMAQVEQISAQRGACKLTLEVLQGNEAAQQSYIKYGFKGYELDPKMGKALFWEKPIAC